MEFPHLSDTKFPNVDNVDVYKYKNEFDYARWKGKVSFKLLNVLWNSNYSDVPYFETDVERDNWFDSKDGYFGTFETAFNNTPIDTLKIPIPYNDAIDFNYLVIDMPIQTSASNPIDYEDANKRISRFYYFIEDMEQFAPSTTEIKITLDYWTTFIHYVDIPYMMLERGHAPMVQTSVEQYLANPIMNNEYLLADDFNYSNETIIKTTQYKPIGNGKKYVLFCAPYSQSDFANFGGTAYSGNSTPPTFSDINNRWGYQLQVNDYEWKYGNSDYSSANLPIENQTQNGLLNGCACYAIEGSYAKAFFNEVAENCVNFLHGIQAFFILDEDMFSKGTGFTFRNKTIYPVTQKHNTFNFNLNKSLFGFDDKYKNITKLYTSPYSLLEVTDDNGNSFTAKIENSGSIKLHTEVSIVYPFLNYNVFFTGFNGDGTAGYVWKNIDDTNSNMEMWASDFSKYMMNWKIPTYSIFISMENEFAANNAAGMAAKRKGAIVDYENATRYANTTRANTADSFDTNTDNVAASGQTNTDNVAASGATNTGNTQRTTSKNVTNTAATQAGLMDNMEDENDTHDLITDTYLNGNDTFGPQADGFLPKTTWANWEKLADDGDTDWMYLHDSFNANADYFCSTSVVNGAASIFGGGSSAVGSISGAGKKSNAMSIGAPIVGGIASGIATTVSIPLTVSKDQTLTDLQQHVIDDKLDHASTNMSKGLHAQVEYNANVKNANNDLRKTIVTRFSDSNGINNANEGRDKTCEDANAYDVQTTNNANAARLQATNNANAVRTQDTETDNAGYTRDATIAAEQSNLRQKQLEAESQYRNSRLQRPSTQGDYQGDFAPDMYKRRGVRFNIRTQSKSAIAQTGDAMLRYGYALHRVWDMSRGFHYCKEFTFWKADDVWVNDGIGIMNNTVSVIRAILMQGVTVWRNPDKITKVSIYDNI